MARHRQCGISAQDSARGAALAISLLLLIVMTILGIAASQVVRMQAQSATNTRDRDIAFQKAETGLRAAERWLDGADLVALALPCELGRCRVYAPGGIDPSAISSSLALKSDNWWHKHGWEDQATDGAAESHSDDADDPAMSPPPRFVIEQHGEILDTLTISPTGPAPRRNVYQISAAAEAGPSRSITVLQSRFVRRLE